MELLNDFCHWCESPIARPNKTLQWLDEDKTAVCLFHPANWNPKTMKTTSEFAGHQTIEEVYEIVKSDYFRERAMRRKLPLRAVEDSAVMIRKDAQRTSSKAAEKILPVSGTIRRRVYDAIKNAGYRGMTDEDLERLLGGKHQTISSSRRSLVVDGWIVDSGRIRKNPAGFDCIVWIEKNEQIPTTMDFYAQ